MAETPTYTISADDVTSRQQAEDRHADVRARVYLTLMTLVPEELDAQSRILSVLMDLETQLRSDLEELHQHWRCVVQLAYAMGRSEGLTEGLRAINSPADEIPAPPEPPTVMH